MRFAVLTSLVFTALVAATGGNTCDGGDTYCCNSGSKLFNPDTGSAVAVPIAVLAGLQCVPITIIGGALGTTCSKSTVCCQNVGTNGLVNVQCLALTL